MYSFLLVGLIALIAAIWFGISEARNYSIGDGLWAAGIVLAGGALGFFLVALIFGFIIGPNGLFGKDIQATTYMYTENLVNMSQFEGIHGEIQGSFLRIHGQVDSVACYGYYTPTSDGGLTPQQICSEFVTVYENDSETPRIETYETPFEVIWGKWTYGNAPEMATYYKIYVPEGTVTRDMSLGFPEGNT